MEQLRRASQIVGEQRDKVKAELAKRYEHGASVRSLAEDIGRSYGFVHRILRESGVTMRLRGGNTRLKKTAQ
jgi:hypothetical protein